MPLPAALLNIIAGHLDVSPSVLRARPAHGGDIAQSFHLTGGDTQAFLKLMLAAQAEVLNQ